MRIFLEKTVKIASASEALSPNPVHLRRLVAGGPRVVATAYYYNFVEFISSAKCVLLP